MHAISIKFSWVFFEIEVLLYLFVIPSSLLWNNKQPIGGRGQFGQRQGS